MTPIGLSAVSAPPLTASAPAQPRLTDRIRNWRATSQHVQAAAVVTVSSSAARCRPLLPGCVALTIA
ncbi:MAG: hypothetical protein ACJ74O_13895 [Frankiaceae bacterium]